MRFQRLYIPVLICLFSCLGALPGTSSNSDAGTFEAASAKEVRLIRAKIRAAQFLSKATFGPTQLEIETLGSRINQIGYRRACDEWIEDQFAKPKSSHTQTALDIIASDNRVPDQQSVGVHNYRYQAWWHIALTRDDQLRQKVTWALAQIFVISDSGSAFNNDDKRSKGNGEYTVPDWMGMGDYYDMLCSHAFGNYRDILGDVTWHPCMGAYLSSWRNRKANLGANRLPDENYAREIKQLFSVGLYELYQDGRYKTDENGALIPTYDNDHIKELARVFTGFKSFHNTSTSFYAGRNYGDAMVMHHQEHDNNQNYSEDPNAPASKTIFGVTLSPLPDPLTNEAATAEVNEALDVIANHDNVAPFICRLMIQRMVKSNPSRAYIRRVTRKFRDNGQGVRGDMKAVVKAILLDPELFRGQRLLRQRNPNRVEVVTRGAEHSRLREPLMRLTAMLRALNPSSNWPNNDPETGEPFMMLDQYLISDLGQMAYRAPSVFNFYLPNYQPPDLVGVTPSRRLPYDSLFAPEFQILDAVLANRFVNRMRSICLNRYLQRNVEAQDGSDPSRITLDLSEELELARSMTTFPEILDRFDLLLCNGSLSEEAKTAIINNTTAEAPQDWRYIDRLEQALLAVLLSPDCAIEE